MKRHLESYVVQDIFRNQRPPPTTRRRYYPSNKDITNYMQCTRMRQRHSKIDQENLVKLLEKWRVEKQEDSFYFRPCKATPPVTPPDTCSELDNNLDIEDDTPTDDDIAASDDSSGSGLLFCYQSKSQQRLLTRYGNQMCLLDATYKTTKYALPLFFLCVRTNVCYQVVAVFLTQYENASSIREALAVFKNWNPQWNPTHFMVDFDSAEILALEQVFPGTVLLSLSCS